MKTKTQAYLVSRPLGNLWTPEARRAISFKEYNEANTIVAQSLMMGYFTWDDMRQLIERLWGVLLMNRLGINAQGLKVLCDNNMLTVEYLYERLKDDPAEN